MLDVVTLVSADTPKAWVQQCHRSIEQAIALASEPINRIVSPGVPGHIGKAMLQALKRSTGDYVAVVDDDDFVLPNALTCLAPHFAASPEAICAREITLAANGLLTPSMNRHHLTAWRRDLFTGEALDQARPFGPLFRRIEHTAVDELSWVYVYRVRLSGGLALRGKRP